MRHARSLSTSASSAGSSTSARALCSISAWLVLLMSSLVQAKCTNSAAADSSASPSKPALIQYSTALTSWLVVFSMSLMACASASEKTATRRRSFARAPLAQRLELGKPGVGQRDEPFHLHLHAAVHQAVFAEQRAQRRHLGGIAAVERRQRGQGGQFHGAAGQAAARKKMGEGAGF
jgi:hypothetical protein